jgi:hypothetical protein
MQSRTIFWISAYSLLELEYNLRAYCMYYQVSTNKDLEFALEYVKPRDRLIMPRAMYEINLFKILSVAQALSCESIRQECPNIYTGFETTGTEVFFMPK